MGIPVLILGKSGSGKSTSLRNFNEDEVVIFNVASKPLPFRKKLPKQNSSTYKSICDGITKGVANSKIKTYVIDDSQYLMAFELFSRTKETGYGKFTDMACNFKNLIDFVIRNTPSDVIVYFLHHVQESEYGIKAKTVGKMLDDQLTVEGMFSVVLMTHFENGKYTFLTQTDGYNTVKSPMDMFNDRNIDNDLKAVDKAIREYWELEGSN